MLGLGASLAKGGASLLTYVKDNLKLYLDFKSNRSDTLAFPSEGSTEFVASSSQYITIPNSSSLAFADGQGFSASIWFKTSTSSEMYLFDNRDGSGEGFAVLINGSGSNYIGYANDGSNQVTFTNTVDYNDGSWHHLAFTWNGTETLTSYIDGVVVGTGTQASLGAVDGGDLIIGKPTASDTKYWNGKMANLAIWSRALSPEEVQSVMNKSYSQLGSVEKTSLEAWWSLDSANNGVVQPATGEELGSDTFVGLNQWVPKVTDREIVSVSGDEITLTIPTAGDGGMNTGNLANLGLSTSLGYAVGDFVKFQFEGKIITNGSGFGATLRFYEHQNYVFTLTDISLTSEYQTFTFYGKITNLGYSIPYLLRMASRTGTDVYKFKNFNVQKITSNTGVVTGATTTTSVYGGNAPVLPRAIDIAESFADRIGNGSALFDKSNTDYISVTTSVHQTTKGTISGWFYPVLGGDQALFSVGTASVGKIRSLFLNGANLKFIGYGADWDTTVDIVTNTWYHLALTWDGNDIVVYVNGIAYPNSSLTLNTPDGTELKIGTATWSESYYSDGNISQLGIWQGALSQSQIQFLMESTSYAKIPASVKSNLGSEIASNNFGGWTLNGWTDNGDNTVSANNSSGGNQDLTISYSFTTSTLYKITATFSNISGNFHYSMDGTGGLDKTITTNGEQILYIKTSGSGASSFFIRSTNSSSATISNVSIKEVTCDLVAYYPLDADSSNTVKTDDLVGGETLGSNFVDDHQESHYSHSGTTMDNITNGVKFTYVSNAQGGYVYLKGASILSGNLNYGNLYKATFNAYYEGGSSGVSVSIYQGAGSDVFGDVLTTSNAEYSIYFIPLSAAAFIRLQNFASSNIVYLTNLEIKEVTSNTGVLK